MTRRRECGTKRGYQSRQEALAAARHNVIKRGMTFADTWVYKCQWCKWWHTGHRPGYWSRYRRRR